MLASFLSRNNLINISYYLIGLSFFSEVNEKNSIYFSDLALSSTSFYLLLFLLVLPIFAIYFLPLLVLYKKNKEAFKLLVYDCEYKKGYGSIKFFHYIALFFSIVFSHYSVRGKSFAILIVNIFMFYLTILCIYQPLISKEIFLIKVVSLAGIISSFFNNYEQLIILNSLIYVFLIGMIIKKIYEANKHKK